MKKSWPHRYLLTSICQFELYVTIAFKTVKCPVFMPILKYLLQSVFILEWPWKTYEILNLLSDPKRIPEYNTTSQNPKMSPRIWFPEKVLDNGTRFWILGRALDSEKCMFLSRRVTVFKLFSAETVKGKEIIVTQVRFQARINKWMKTIFTCQGIWEDTDYLLT